MGVGNSESHLDIAVDDRTELDARLFDMTASCEWFRRVVLGLPLADDDLVAFSRRICDAMNKAKTTRDFAFALKIVIAPLAAVLETIEIKED